MALVFIGLGSNLGKGRYNLKEAWQRLGKVQGVTPLTLSSPYRTEPVGMESEQLFTNAVGALETSLPPRQLLHAMLAIELDMGRDRSAGKDRSVDLDILYYDDLVISEAELEIPHPGIASRLFVLAPLAELAPDHIHPGLGLSSRQMLRDLRSTEQVEQINWT